MPPGPTYIPSLIIKPSEIDALKHLPGTDLDRMLPIFQLRRWRKAKTLDVTFDKLGSAIDGRRCIIDLAGDTPTEDQPDLDLKALASPSDGFSAWVNFIHANPNFVPVLQRNGEISDIARQFSMLERMEKGVVIRCCRSTGWKTSDLAAPEFLETTSPLLIVLDYGQIPYQADNSFVALQLVSAASSVRKALPKADLTFCLAASSFPKDFSAIHKKRFRLPISERSVYSLVLESPIFQALNCRLIYGDYGSVFGERRGQGRRGAPRVDLPGALTWVYRREPDGTFSDAAAAVMGEEEWDNELLIWGTEEIRRAAKGDLERLKSPQGWTAVRIHLHLHQQVNFDGGKAALLATEEPWTD